MQSASVKTRRHKILACPLAARTFELRMRIAIISDTHLAARAEAFAANARAACTWIDVMAPDLVVHLGDVTVDGAFHAQEMDFARDLFAGRPLHWLPGNHDIGNPPCVPQSASESVFSAEALAYFRTVLGPDRWVIERGGWQILGLNAQLFGLGDAEEEGQFHWIEQMLASSRAKLGVMLHKPLFRNGPVDTEEYQRYLPVAPRRRLTTLFEGRDLRFVIAGHTHQLRTLRAGGVEHIWAPSSAYFIPDAVQERIGQKHVGVMLLELGADRHEWSFAMPDGVRQNDLSDFADLYPEIAERLAHSAAAAD
jgi:3',5'-cyclic AMP phosphodiesterase CpdA